MPAVPLFVITVQHRVSESLRTVIPGEPGARCRTRTQSNYICRRSRLMSAGDEVLKRQTCKERLNVHGGLRERGLTRPCVIMR